MASVFEQALAQMAQPQQAPGPMFTPEQMRQRIEQNNELIRLGMLGRLSSDEGISNTGSAVFKQALGDRQERYTDHGIVDPLSGNVAMNPEYAAQQQEGQRDKIFNKALAYEDQRQRAEERAAQAKDAEAAKLERQRERAADEVKFARMFGAFAQRSSGQDAEMQGLKKTLLQAQIDAIGTRQDTALAKMQTARDKVKMIAQQGKDRASRNISTLQEALKLVDWTTTGAVGSQARKVPGTAAYNLERLIETAKANAGFQELNDMRQASPTGGALGQVAVQELKYLQSTISNLDTGQSPAAVRKQIEKAIKHHQAIGGDFQQAEASQDVPTPMPAPMPQPGPGPGGPMPTPVPQPVQSPGTGPAPIPQAGGRVRKRYNPATGQIEIVQ